MSLPNIYQNILDNLKKESQLQNYVGDFWDIFDDYKYTFPNLAIHLISVVDNQNKVSKREMLYKLSIYFDLFLKCVELNINIVNQIDKSNSIEQLMVLNLISIIILKINTLCQNNEHEHDPKLINMLKDMFDKMSINHYLNINHQQQLLKLRLEMTQCLCNFIFYFI